MRGFTDKALILLSKPDSFEECGSIYKYDYKVAIDNIINYLDSMGISHDCLITDGLATNMNMHNPLPGGWFRRNKKESKRLI